LNEHAKHHGERSRSIALDGLFSPTSTSATKELQYCTLGDKAEGRKSIDFRKQFESKVRGFSQLKCHLPDAPQNRTFPSQILLLMAILKFFELINEIFV